MESVAQFGLLPGGPFATQFGQSIPAAVRRGRQRQHDPFDRSLRDAVIGSGCRLAQARWRAVQNRGQQWGLQTGASDGPRKRATSRPIAGLAATKRVGFGSIWLHARKRFAKTI